VKLETALTAERAALVVERSRVNQLVSQMNEKEAQLSEQGDAIVKMAELAKHVSQSFPVPLEFPILTHLNGSSILNVN